VKDHEISVPQTIAEKVAKVGSVQNYAMRQTNAYFEQYPLGNMVVRYGSNLPTYTRVKHAISRDFDRITTNIYEGKSGDTVIGRAS
jgi:hypothetical protein